MARRRSKRRSRGRSRSRRNPLTRLGVKALMSKRNKTRKQFVKDIKTIDAALHEKGKRAIHDAIVSGAKAHASKPRKKPQHGHLPVPAHWT